MKIVILDRNTLGDDTPLEEIERHGELVCYDSTAPDQVSARIRGADVVIVNKVKMPREVILSSNTLKLICVFATGYDNIDVAAAREKGVGVCNVPGYSSDSVAMYTVSTVLALATHIIEHNEFVRSGEYTLSGMANRLTPVFHEIRGKVWGVVGYGGIGSAVANIARAMGAEVVVCKQTEEKSVRCVDIDTLCRISDIITLHVPLTEKTQSLISKDRIQNMKENVILVNEARGKVVDEEAVAAAVLSGKIAAFGCDVYSKEPFDFTHPYDGIKHLKNVILTPHAAWAAYEARARCAEIIGKNIDSYKMGEFLNRVDITRQN